MILDLSKYANTVGTYSDSDAAKAIEDKYRPLEAGIHECVLVEFKKMKPYNAEPNTEDQLCIIAKDPNWLMFTPVFENASGARTPVTVMMPLTNELRYKSVDGTETTYPYKTFMDFVSALGFDPLEEERAEVTFMRAITRTNAECLLSLVNSQVKVKVEWGDSRCVHPQYDAESKCYWLVDANGTVPSEDLQEPFMINKDLKGKERWAEMALRAKDSGYFFQQNPTIKILRHDTIKNDLSVFLPKKAPKPTITKLVTKPAVATITKPPIATKAPITREILVEDAEIPEE